MPTTRTMRFALLLAGTLLWSCSTPGMQAVHERTATAFHNLASLPWRHQLQGELARASRAISRGNGMAAATLDRVHSMAGLYGRWQDRLVSRIERGGTSLFRLNALARQDVARAQRLGTRLANLAQHPELTFGSLRNLPSRLQDSLQLNRYVLSGSRDPDRNPDVMVTNRPQTFIERLLERL